MNRNKKKLAAEIGSRIKQIRGEDGLEVFARKIRVAHPTLYRYETDRIPDIPTLIKIAEQDREGRGFLWLTLGQGALYKEGQEAPTVADAPGITLDKKRIELINAVKRLMTYADDGTVEALTTNVREFSRIDPKKKKED